jgi:hypothetical protein
VETTKPHLKLTLLAELSSLASNLSPHSPKPQSFRSKVLNPAALHDYTTLEPKSSRPKTLPRRPSTTETRSRSPLTSRGTIPADLPGHTRTGRRAEEEEEAAACYLFWPAPRAPGSWGASCGTRRPRRGGALPPHPQTFLLQLPPAIYPRRWWRRRALLLSQEEASRAVSNGGLAVWVLVRVVSVNMSTVWMVGVNIYPK